MRTISLILVALFGLLTCSFIPYQSQAIAPLQPRLRLLSDADHQSALKLWPTSNDAALNALKRDPRLTFYTEEVMPECHQDWSSGLPGLHSRSYNISAGQPVERFGNPNLEFPWGVTGGTDRSIEGTPGRSGNYFGDYETGVKSVKFVRFPAGGAIEWWQESLSPDRYGQTLRWEYPPGTIFGEILTLRSPQGGDFTFEVRTRGKQSDGSWKMNAYRPFTTPAELTAAVKRHAPNWKKDEKAAALVKHLQAPPTPNIFTLQDRHPQPALQPHRAQVDYLPPIDEKLVEKLLTKTPFKSALGQDWQVVDGVAGHAPSTHAEFHIVPREYTAAFFSVDSKGCMACHDTAGKHADDFDYGRDWYGRVRGDDRIFSFHPFAPESISFNGVARPVSFRRELLDAGLLKQRR